ncbi:MAG: glycosyltransferase family 4 protein [Parcubacteria group bacterium]
MKLLIITQKVNENDQLLGFFIEWIDKFAKHFDRVTVLCLEKGSYSLSENVSVLSMGKENGANRAVQLKNFYSMIIGKRSDYDVVFVHMSPIWTVLGGLVWRLMGKRIFLWYTSGGVTFKLRIAVWFSHIVFTASKESFRIKSKKARITGHGIDTELFASSVHVDNAKADGSHALRLLSIGRIAPIKNYETLIDACRILKDKKLLFEVDVIGEATFESDRKYLEDIKDHIESLEMENNFSFLGKINNRELVKHYQSADIFIHMSKTGSLDKVLLEAMACGTKVLSSNDASRGFLEESLLFDENDSSDLAEKIIILANTKVDLKFREYVIENHNVQILIPRLANIMKS